MPPAHTRTRVVGVVAACIAASGLLVSCASQPDPSTPTNLFDALPPTSTLTAAPLPSPSPQGTTASGSPTTTRRASRAGSAVIGPQWKLVSGDEFNAGALSNRRWGTYYSVGAFGNGLRRPSAISEGGGNVTITASGNVSGGMADAFSQLYGRWEFRARTDLGRGFGSAILLWPNSENLNDGEVDIMEVPDETRNVANFVLHSGADGDDQVGTNVPGAFDQWHTFAVEWLPTSITWYVDGQRQYTVTQKSRIPTTPMHLAIQLDEGPKEDWIPAPDATTPAKLRLQVDYERVWAWANAPAAPANNG